MDTDSEKGAKWLSAHRPSLPKAAQGDGFPVCANMKKWPPLTTEDLNEISKENFVKTDKKRASKEQIDEDANDASLVIGPNSVWSLATSESWLVQQLTEAELDDVRTVSSFTELDTG